MKKILLILLIAFVGVTAFGQLDTVNVGTSANSGDGESLRSAFFKVNNQIKAWNHGLVYQRPYSYVIEEEDGVVTAYPAEGSGLTEFADTNLTSVLQDAMDELTTGGSIFIRRGTYDHLNFMTLTNSNVTIKGEGKFLTKLKLKAAADRGLSGTGTPLLRLTAVDNVTISDIEFDGNGFAQDSIDDGDNTVEVAKLMAIRLGTYCNNVVIENCFIHDWTKDGIYVASTYYGVVIRHNLIHAFWNGITTYDAAKYVKIYNNEVYGVGDVGIAMYGSNHLCENNVVRDDTGSFGADNYRWGIGIEWRGGANDSIPYKTIIKGNKIYGRMTSAIFINGGYDNEVTDNTIYPTSDLDTIVYGINIGSGYRHNVSNNNIIDANRYGIFMNGADTCFISGNKVTTRKWNVWATGFQLQNNSNNNTISNNHFTGYRRGMLLQSTNVNNIIIGNFLKGVTMSDMTDYGTSNNFKSNWGVKAGAWLGDV